LPSYDRFLLLSSRAHDRLVSQRRHPAASRGQAHRRRTLSLPALSQADRLVRQYSVVEFPIAPRQLPTLRQADLLALSARGAFDRFAVWGDGLALGRQGALGARFRR